MHADVVCDGREGERRESAGDADGHRCQAGAPVGLTGSGKSRMLPPLVPGHEYVGRVAAIGKDGKQSAWTTELTFVG